MTGNKAVTAEQFATARAAHQEASNTLIDAYADVTEARKRLEGLACNARFTIPGDGHGHGDLTENCRRAPLHAEHHAEDPTGDGKGAASSDYRDAYGALVDAEIRLAAANRRFKAAADLSEYQCHYAAPGDWGCILHQDHSGPHQEPDELRLVLG
ncbi:hypothetical protein [Brachybacterium tyrofermentans]|uniref:hypothetical protein n=1 Tax=Brachybacterium tyrofermentans TaxID=47848 RepID=UPI003FD68FA5